MIEFEKCVGKDGVNDEHTTNAMVDETGQWRTIRLVNKENWHYLL